MKRGILAICLIFFGTSALPFEDGFEARASDCKVGLTIDFGNDGLPPILVKPGVLVCNDAGNFATECVMENGMCKRAEGPKPPEPPSGDLCRETYPVPPADARFTAFGLKPYTVAWTAVWGYPPGDKRSPLRNVARDNLGTSETTYLSIPFTMSVSSGPMSSFSLAQGPAQGDLNPTGLVTMTISPCSGDFRAAVNGTTDPYLKSACRRQGTSGQLTASASASAAAQGYCPMPAGRVMYLNIVNRPMLTAPSLPPRSCKQGEACGTAMQFQ